MFINENTGLKYSYSVPKSEPDLLKLKEDIKNNDKLIGKNVIEICRFADIVFNALHGDIGENGKLQAVFDVYGIKYTGTGYVGSLLAMDKYISKQLIRNNVILTSDWNRFKGGAVSVSDVADGIGFPCVVKPLGCGSSVGVSIVRDAGELERAVTEANRFEDCFIIEKYIAGRELSVGILDGKTLPPIEIIPNEGFYNYINKYQIGLTKEICPADLPDDVNESLLRSAEFVHNVLLLGDYSRIDYMLDDANNAYVLEANTLPGMTPTSLLPQMAAAVGISYNDLCEKIVTMASGY
jgi:D-alanine-D-alanine ligase